jgi:hypothetical protein
VRGYDRDSNLVLVEVIENEGEFCYLFGATPGGSVQIANWDPHP